MGFEERFSNLFSRGNAKAQQAVAAAQGKAMPPLGGNRLTNFLAFPPGTDPSVNETGMIQRGVYRVPQTLRTIINNNSPIAPVSAKPEARAAVRVTQAVNPIRPVARGTTVAVTSWQDRVRDRAIAAQLRVRGMLGG